MLFLKSNSDAKKIRESGKIVHIVLQEMAYNIKPGITTIELNTIAEDIIKKSKGTPAFKGYMGFPFCICASVNEEAVHGLPNNITLKEGDIVSIDTGVYKDGFFADAAVTVGVKKIKKNLSFLLTITEKCLYNAIEKCVQFNRLGDVSNIIQETSKEHGFKTLNNYGGHGVGRLLHEEPYVPNFGIAGKGLLLKAGIVLAIEPILSEGSACPKIKDDNWTVVADDNSYTAHFEHTIIVTEGEAIILTDGNCP